MRTWPLTYYQDGTSQAQRKMQALQSGYFRTDERDFGQLLAYCRDVAGQIQFIGEDGRAQGNWRTLFDNNETALLAILASKDTALLKQQFEQLHHQGHQRRLQMAQQLLQEIEHWHDCLLQLGTPLALQLVEKSSAILRHSLSNPLQQLLQAGDTLDAPYPYRQGTWLAQLKPGSVPPQKSARLGQMIEQGFSALLSLLRILQEELTSHLATHQDDLDTEPALALLMAFIHLYLDVQKGFDRLSHKHLLFYYDDYLRSEHLAGEPQRLWMATELNDKSAVLALPADSQFVAGKDEAGKERYFHTEKPVELNGITLGPLHSLRLGKDPRISPETELGYVALIHGRRAIHADRPLFSRPQEQDNRAQDMGIAILSPMLNLSEGNRFIQVDLELALPQEWGDKIIAAWKQPDQPLQVRLAEALSVLIYQLGTELDLPCTDKNQLAEQVAESYESQTELTQLPGLVYRDFLLVQLQLCQSSTTFMPLFGRLFGYYLLGPADFLPVQAKQVLGLKIQALFTGQEQLRGQTLEELLTTDPMTVFYRYCSDLLGCRLSTAQGLQVIHNYNMLPCPTQVAGLRICIKLDSSFPAIAPLGGETSAALQDLPQLQLYLNPTAKLCGYSLLTQLQCIAYSLSVQVQGAKQLNLSNQLGTLDGSKAFLPFGPAPRAGAFLAFNHRDWVGKPLNQVGLTLHWADLPNDENGFADHYAGYPQRPDNQSFEAELEMLYQGKWQHPCLDSDIKSAHKLFAEQPMSMRLSPKQQLSTPITLSFEMRAEHASKALSASMQQGFMRLRLSHPVQGFGQLEYQNALAQALIYNSKHKNARPLPKSPYVPGLEGVSLDYCAAQRVDLCQDPKDSQAGQADRLVQLLPFGCRPLYPKASMEGINLVPAFTDDAYLFVPVTPRANASQLSLLFELDTEPQGAHSFSSLPLRWQYLKEDSWHDVAPGALLMDSTLGLATSGIVRLKLPMNLPTSHQAMPSGYGWLRTAVSGPLTQRGKLRGLWTNAFALIAKDRATRLPTEETEIKWHSSQFQGSISQYHHWFSPHPPREAESGDKRLQRIAERLCHKQRAATIWDYERLVLQAFPQLHKVKCFPNLKSGSTASHPGYLVLALVPKQGQCNHQDCARLGTGVELLQAVKDFVSALASPFAHIEVILPGFEQLQIRCAVKLQQALTQGNYLEQLNQTINQYLCPWQTEGPSGRFAAQIRPDAIKAHIQEQAYVDYVTDFSILHISQSAVHYYHLDDTARNSDIRSPIRPRFPWNLLMPSSQHALSYIDHRHSIEAQPTGIGELEIGRTFILQRDIIDG
ncbi:hypothetical protein P2G88_02875 [Aliiglaciecola sp. CAU 1673]|uniref:hypothetical protein n=1 Tax=Aliiglaciecola sp. CAU 1673 TaxID=3032595 RepID=UPI0023DAED61|nr:hypothetical protein [Aliiglaciecola sp. CAU 1673]MDF2177187.1 hypothetical protein [Aliiglaciecola sp. CAU 1673]